MSKAVFQIEDVARSKLGWENLNLGMMQQALQALEALLSKGRQTSTGSDVIEWQQIIKKLSFVSRRATVCYVHLQQLFSLLHYHGSIVVLCLVLYTTYESTVLLPKIILHFDSIA